ncbi:MAG TPA: type VI secretion system tube protein Hcp [Alphaproteobacteria bacterium]|jgi:type VI secretion system secreted protein Hcp|nr:type VI secretion system tube protein Hcp [Alphaproteobacteria bacterium]
MIYLQFGSIQGDATQSAHVNWIQLLSVNWGLTRPVSNPAGSTAGRVLAAPRLAELSVTKDEDSATIPLIQQALSGSPQDATIDFISEATGDGLVYYSIALKQAVITAFTQGSSGDRPVETMTFNFTQISFSGTQIDTDGTAGAPSSYGWDVAANAPA